MGWGQIYWYRCNLGQKSSYWCYRAIPEEGGGLGDVRCDGWNISRHLRKPWIRWKPWKPCHRRKPVDTMGTWTAFWPFSYLPFHLGNKTFNWETKYEQTKNVLQKQESHMWNTCIRKTFWNCLKFKLFYREREFMNNLLSYLYMHGQRRNRRKFWPEKVKYSKGEMLINIVDISFKKTFWCQHLNRTSSLFESFGFWFPWVSFKIFQYFLSMTSVAVVSWMVTLLCGGAGVIFIRRRRGNIYPPPYLSMSGAARVKHAPNRRKYHSQKSGENVDSVSKSSKTP